MRNLNFGFRAQCIFFTSAFSVTALLLLAVAEPAEAATAPPADETCAALRAEAAALGAAQQARGAAMAAATAQGSGAVEAQMAETRRNAAAGAAMSTVTGIAAGALPGVGPATGLLGSIAGRATRTDDRSVSEAKAKMSEAQAGFAAGLHDMARMMDVATAMQARGC